MNPFLTNIFDIFKGNSDKGNSNKKVQKRQQSTSDRVKLAKPLDNITSKSQSKKLLLEDISKEPRLPKTATKVELTTPAWPKAKINVIKTTPIKKQLSKKLIRPLMNALNPLREIEKNVILKRHDENPIVCPKEDSWWEAWQTFNPGVCVLDDDRVHLIYRAMGGDAVSRFGYASSPDGFHVDDRLNNPVFEHKIKSKNGFAYYYDYHSGGSFAGAEDPCITYMQEDDTIYITYTACEDGLRVGLTTIKQEDFLKRTWNFSEPKILSKPGEIHKNWVIFPEKINGKYAILHNISKGIKVDYVDKLDPEETFKITSSDPQNNPKLDYSRWDTFIRGCGTSPIKTKFGWLVFYHAMSKDNFGKYKIGAMLLDLKDPTKELFRSKLPVLEPIDGHVENNGCKPGIVYTKGAVIKDDEILLYYGASDNYICVASANYDDFLESLRYNKKPNFIRRLLKIAKRLLKKDK